MMLSFQQLRSTVTSQEAALTQSRDSIAQLEVQTTVPPCSHKNCYAAQEGDTDA